MFSSDEPTSTDVENYIRSFRSVGVQATVEPLHFNHFLLSLDGNDSKLNSLTGIPNFKILEKMVQAAQLVRPSDKYLMSLKSRILLTMFRLKTNLSNTEVSIIFQVTDKTAKQYFVDTIQLLSKVLNCLIYWQSHEENLKSLPKCFEDFPQTMTVLDCTEIKTCTFNCLHCRMCMYSHYKGCHTVKILIGVSPSGMINFVSKATAGRASDKAIFNSTNLLEKLNKGDAVMVDKGFMIGDELSKAGIEMIRPAFMYHKMTKSEVIRNTRIASARVHVERRIARIKTFKILGEKVYFSILPYIY